MLDDDDLFSHRVQPKLGLAASDELASDLFPAKAALASSSSSGSGYRRDAADHDAENRDAFPSFPRGGRGGDSYGSRDRYDSERAKRNSRYEMSDRVDKWTKNSDLSVRISHGSRFPRGTNDDNDESRRKSSNQHQGRRNWRSHAGRSRSRSRSFSPDRRDDYMGKEERSFGSRLGGKRDDGNNRQSGGRSWDRRDRGRS